MKMVLCNTCETELEFLDVHEDGTRLMIKPCKKCFKEAFSNGYESGQNDMLCSEEDYQEGYNEAEAYYQEKLDILNEEIAELKKELDND